MAAGAVMLLALGVSFVHGQAAVAQPPVEREVSQTAGGQMEKAAVVWPPVIPGADAQGVLTLRSEAFLHVPEKVAAAGRTLGYAFEMAKLPPTVELVFHGDLPDQGIGPDNGTGWTSWGDICVARDGSVYCAIGDHGPDGTRLKPGQKADAHVFVYRWLPGQRKLEQVVRPNEVVDAGADDPRWAKIHARIFETREGKIVFIPTFNDGQRAPDVKWTSRIPTGQIFLYDPGTGRAEVVGLLPENSATATTHYDRRRNVLYVNLEGQFKNALFAYDLNTNRPAYQGPAEMISQNRNMAISRAGVVYYNAADGALGQYDPQAGDVSLTGMVFEDGAAMRASTRQAADGWIYATTYGGKNGRVGQLVRFHPEQKKVERLGYDFLNISNKGVVSNGNYTTVAVLSPDEKFVYYLPGAHGGAVHIGTPVVQYDIASGRTKVLAFLADAMEKQADYVPGGTYGVGISEDGATLYVNFNGHAAEKNRLERMKPNGFGLTAFAAIHIPESER